MIIFSRKINEDYAWELCLFHRYRSVEDGITFIEHTIEWDRYLADHSPRFEWSLRLFNYVIFEFNIYYLHHRDE